MIITVIVTILMFLVMVSLHEFGHFIVGKLLNFKILEYSIGFGPALLKRQGKETQYSLRAVPLGGYCKFEGDDEESDDPRAFSRQSVWKRFLVVAAGGIMNVILGFAIFVVVVASTSPMYTNTVESVVENSYIESSGILPGDKIVRLGGKRINFYDDITLYREELSSDADTEIIVKRDGEKLKFNIRLTEQNITYNYTESGIDITESINGEETKEFVPYSEDNPKENYEVGTEQTVTRNIIGFVPKQEDVTALNVWGQAWNETRFVVKLVYRSLWEMVTGKVGVEQMSGPVGIVSEVNNAVTAKDGMNWLYVLNLVGLLTINLGIFNLLPIPALDGGRLFFMLIEFIRRKPIPPEKEGMVHAIGMMLLFGLIIFISFNDVMKLLGR